LIVANQFTTQLTEEIRDAVFGNTGTIVAFRVGQDEDAEALAKRMRPAFDPGDLLRMPNYNAAVRMLINGVPTQPFSMATLPPLGDPNPKLAGALKQLSAAKYGRPKALVEKEIFERLATKTPAAPPPRSGFGSTPPAQSFGQSFNGRPAASGASFGGPSPAAPPAPGTGSFLDEWMSKRESKGPLLRQNPWAKGPGANPGVPAQAAPVRPAPAPASTTAPAQSMSQAVPAAVSAPAQSPTAQPLIQPPAAAQAAPAVQLQPNPSTDLAAPTQPAVKSDDEKEKEIAAAAEEVAKKLKASTLPATPPSGTAPHTLPQPQPTQDHTTGEIPLFKTKKEESDTIFIDPDGTLHMR